MARLLQGLIVAALVSSAQTSFNHQAALAQKIECLTCHAVQKNSTSLSEKHKGKILKDFNHALHLKMGNIASIVRAAIDSKKYLASPNKVDLPALRAHLDTQNPCQACHRGLDSSTGPLTKANFPHMEDCLVCHNKIDNPFSCSQCHAESFQLKPANHAPDFLDRHTTGKLNLDKTTCASCHGQRFTCLGCH